MARIIAGVCQAGNTCFAVPLLAAAICHKYYSWHTDHHYVTMACLCKHMLYIDCMRSYLDR